MSEVSTTGYSFVRTTASGRGGAVAGKMSPAVDAGIAILEAGGNAIDAAVATAFAMGVAEPGMNGIGGGGFLVGWLAAEQRAFTIEYPMISPFAATPDMFPLAGGVEAGLFGWPRTVDNANVVGYRSIAIPGTVAGLCLALQRYGSLPLSTVLEPAIAMAEAGTDVTWHTTLIISRDLANLRRFEPTASLYLDEAGTPPVTGEGLPTPKLRNPKLARTLRAIAEGGPEAFYRGSLAKTMVDHLATNGTPVTYDDFASYTAIESPGLSTSLAGQTVYTMGAGSGGTSLVEALGVLDRLDITADQHNSPAALHKLAFAFRQAFADRYTYLADPAQVEVPLDALLSPAYLDSVTAGFDPDQVTPIRPGSREHLGVRHHLAGSVPEYMQDGSTTHLGVIDSAGNAVSLTQTLLSLWGSRVTEPETGVLFNNGMMWFDPEPGRPNSVGPRKRPLSNMAPALLVRDGGVSASIGSSGGRKIMNCNAQLLANLAAHDLPMGDALAAPRIDASTSTLNVSARIPAATRNALANLGYAVDTVDESLLAGGFASPVAISRSPSGELEAAADAWYYPATAKVID